MADNQIEKESSDKDDKDYTSDPEENPVL